MLDDVAVLDLSLQLPGPYCTTLLAALGARIIKVEPPGGDPARQLDPPMFRWLAAGKQSLVLDLRNSAGQGVLHRLVQRADIIVEGYRPGVADRLGASYTTLSALNPGLIYVSISGYGQSGPYRDLPGHDINYLGVGGGLAAAPLRMPPREGTPIGLPVVDLAAGSAAALLAIAALRETSTTGSGRYLDVAMIDHAAYWSCLKAGSILTKEPAGSGHFPSRVDGEPTYGAFRASDGKYLTIGIMEDKFWRRLCEVLEWGDFLLDQRLATYPARKRHRRAIIRRLKGTISTRPRDEWLRQLTASGLPVAPVHNLGEVLTDPQLSVRNLFERDGGGNLQLMPPIPHSVRRTPVSNQSFALGSDTWAVLEDLGCSAEEALALRDAGAFGSDAPAPSGL